MDSIVQLIRIYFAGLTTEDIQHRFWRGNHLNVFVTVCDIQYKERKHEERKEEREKEQ